MAKSKNAGSLDTNVLLRLMLDDVAHQTKAVESLLKDGAQFEVADAAIFEMIFVLEKIYKFTREAILETVYAITRSEQMRCNRALFEEVLPLYKDNTRVSIIDCALLGYARLQAATPLWTFDTDLAKLGGDDAHVL